MRLPSLGATGRTLQFFAPKSNALQNLRILRLASSKHSHNEEPEDPWKDYKPVVPKRASLDDFPVPQGSWKEAYEKRQKRYNLQLGLGLAFISGTLFYIWYADPFKLEYVLGPYKFMKNPPAFDSPVLEPRFDAHLKPEIVKKTEKVSPLVSEVKVAAPEKPVVAVSKPVTVEKTPEVAQPEVAISPKPPQKEVQPKRPENLLYINDPEKAPEIPNHVPYLIIGGGTAAFSAFRAIRANEPSAAVLVISEDSYYPYMRPPLTKELWYSDEVQKSQLRFKQLNGKDRSIYFEHEEFFVEPRKLPFSENGGVGVLRNTRVTRLDPVEQKVTLQNGWQIHYDRCLLATGASPIPLPVLETAGPELMKHVTLFRGVDSFKELDAAIKTAKKVLVIGGGFLGSELACSLARQGKDSGLKVMQVYPEKGNLGRILPAYLSEWLTRKLRIVDGVRVYPERHVKNAHLTKDGVVVQLSDDEEITADHVVVAIGVKPNTDLATGAGLEVDEHIGGYRVNAELQARNNIWAAGDAASFFDVTLGRRRLEHHDHAVATGRIAGENMLGKGKPFVHQSMFWSDIGPEIGFEAVGLIDSSLDTVAVFARPEPSLESSSDLKKIDSGYTSLKEPNPKDDYRRGVIFYLKDKIIVGVLLWNVFSHVSLARKVIKDQKTFGDLGELAKLFTLHDDDSTIEDKNENESEKNPKNKNKI